MDNYIVDNKKKKKCLKKIIEKGELYDNNNETSRSNGETRK